jgi:hypothetical protein
VALRLGFGFYGELFGWEGLADALAFSVVIIGVPDISALIHAVTVWSQPFGFPVGFVIPRFDCKCSRAKRASEEARFKPGSAGEAKSG